MGAKHWQLLGLEGKGNDMNLVSRMQDTQYTCNSNYYLMILKILYFYIYYGLLSVFSSTKFLDTLRFKLINSENFTEKALTLPEKKFRIM